MQVSILKFGSSGPISMSLNVYLVGDIIEENMNIFSLSTVDESSFLQNSDDQDDNKKQK